MTNMSDCRQLQFTDSVLFPFVQIGVCSRSSRTSAQVPCHGSYQETYTASRHAVYGESEHLIRGFSPVEICDSPLSLIVRTTLSCILAVDT